MLLAGFFFFNITHVVHILTIIYQLTNAHNKLQIMTSVELLHVLAPECHSQGVQEQRYVSLTC